MSRKMDNTNKNIRILENSQKVDKLKQSEDDQT